MSKFSRLRKGQKTADAETEAQGAEEQLRRISMEFSDTVDPIIVEDLSGAIIHLNPEAERVFGWSLQELIGKPFKSLFPKELHERIDEIRARCRRGEVLRNVEGFRPTKSGGMAWVLATFSLLTDDAGAPIGIASMSKDITKWKEAELELEESRTRFAGMLDIAVEAIISIDDSGLISLFNQSAEAMFGYAAQEALGQPLEILLPERAKAAHGSHLNAFRRSDENSRVMGRRDEIFGRRKDGTEFPAEASISKLQIEGRMIFTATVTDISERKRTEHEQSLRNQELGTLANIARILAGPVSLRQKQRDCLDALAQLLHTDALVLRKVDESGAGSTLAAWNSSGKMDFEPTENLRHPKWVSSVVIARGEPVVVNDYPSYASATPHFVEIGVRSTACVPIKANGRILATLSGVSAFPGHFNQDVVGVLTTIADGMGVLLQNAQLQESNQSRNRELNALLDISQIGNERGGFEVKCNQIVEELTRVASVDSVNLRIINTESGDLESVASVNNLGIAPTKTLSLKTSPPYKEASEQGLLVIDDYASYAYPHADWLKRGLKSCLFLPLIAPTGIEGIIAFGSKNPSYFTPELVRFLSAIGEGLGKLLENARLAEQAAVELVHRQRVEEVLRRRTQELEALLKFARVVVASESFEESMTQVLEDLRRISEADSSVLLIPNEESQGFHMIASSAISSAALTEEILPPESGIAWISFESGETVVADDYQSHAAANASTAGRGINSAVFVPIKAENRTIAVVGARSLDPNHFTQERVDTLTTLVEGMGMLLENARLNQEIRLKEELEKRRDAFVSVVSHELRTPMTTIMGFSDLLVEREPNPKKRQEWIGYINRESKRLTAIIGDMLDISSIQSGSMKFQTNKLSLLEMLQEPVAFCQSLSDRHLITLDIAPNLPPVIADPDKFAKVMTNLLTNAVKYSPEGGEVHISAESAPGSDRAILTVSDEGVGIAKEDVGELFEVFHRVRRPETEVVTGTGLGLFIVRELMSLMGGEVWVESEIGKGTTFFLSLPIEKKTVHTGRTAD